MNIEELNKQFAIRNHVSFEEGQGNLPVAKIINAFAASTVSLYGANVLSYIPKGQADVLWLSSKSAFEVGKPIRGGVPLCFPHFGPHPSDATQPVHGFARLQMWHVASTSITDEGATQLVLTLNESPTTLAIWPFTFRLSLVVTVGEQLDISLSIHNTGNEPFSTTQAIHTYYHVKNLEGVTLSGLQGMEYYDATDGNKTKKQEDPLLSITKEENRRYFSTESTCLLYDAGLNRKINIAKSGSAVTVVWNPYKEVVKTIGDIADEEVTSFLCVEAANVFQNATTLEPGAMHTLAAHVHLV